MGVAVGNRRHGEDEIAFVIGGKRGMMDSGLLMYGYHFAT